MATNGHAGGRRGVVIPRVTEPVVSLHLIDGTRVDRPLRQLTASQVVGAAPW